MNHSVVIAAWALSCALASPSRSQNHTRAALKFEVVPPSSIVRYTADLVFSSRLSNVSDMPISVLARADGAICPVSVKRNGRRIQKQKSTVMDTGDRDRAVDGSIRTLMPGESIDIVFSELTCRALDDDVETSWNWERPGTYAVQFQYSVVDDGTRLSASSAEVKFTVSR